MSRRLMIVGLLLALALPALASKRAGYEFTATGTAAVFTLQGSARHLEIRTDAEVTVRTWLTSETPSASFDGKEVTIPAGERIFARNKTGYQALTLRASGASATVSVYALR